MGEMTRGEIITAGLRKAGNTNLTLPAQTWLNASLRTQYKAWPWPFLIETATAVPLVAGSTGVVVGGGNGGVTDKFYYPYAPIYVYTTDYTSRNTALIRQLVGGPIGMDLSVINPATGQGLPCQFQISKASGQVYGIWNFIPWPIPNRDYLLTFKYQKMEPNLNDDGQVPLYPSDETMIEMVVASALLDMKDYAAAQASEGKLHALCIGDRLKYGTIPGSNTLWEMDKGVFR